MTPLKDISDHAVLDAWVRSKTWNQAVIAIQHLGFEATAETLRRRVRKILRARAMLPIGRAPTPKDYRRIKMQMLADWRDADIL